MKKRLWKRLIMSCFVLCMHSFSEDLSAAAENEEKLVVDLSGYDWLMEGVLPGEGVKKNFHIIRPDHGIASVPGDVYTDLWRVGRIDDPHFGRNSQKAKWVMDYEWWYFKEFDLPNEMKGRQIRVIFEGVDYACDVWLNGKFLGTHEGMFSEFDFDVTKRVQFPTEREPAWRNTLSVRLHPAPRTMAYVSGRKYRWNGLDYNHNVVPMGIWRPVKIEATGKVRIDDTYIEPKVNSDGSAKLNVKVELFSESRRSKNVELNINVFGANFESETHTLHVTKKVKAGVNVFDIPVIIENPKLWWPWDMGDQNLYYADVSVRDSKAGFQDREKTRFAIRDFKMAMNPGWTKEQVEYPWTAMINGQRHYMRSGTWGGPPDFFVGRAYKNKYREYVRLAKEANINNLRIFGWHPPEIPLFYELCDEEGITVWQDLVPISDYPLLRTQEFKDAVFAEALAMLKRLRNHPCMIIIEGGEEMFYHPSADEREHGLRFVTELGEFIKPHSKLHYIPSSPLSDKRGQSLGFKTNESKHTHVPHYSPGKYFMEEYYPGEDYAAIPELAISSCANVESIKKFIPEDELWPPGPSWGYHWADLDILRIHNFEVLGDQFTDSLQDFVNATQISQGTYFQYALELYRRRKPKTSAVCFCHYNMSTPGMKWSIVDYYLQPKKSYYYVQKAFQPVLVSLEHYQRRWLPGQTFKGNIWVVNDYFNDYKNCTVEYKVLDNNKAVIKQEKVQIGDVAKDSSKKFFEISSKISGSLGDKFYVEIVLKDSNGKKISANDYMFLVADQKTDKALCKQMFEEFLVRRKRGRNYHRYFPELHEEGAFLKTRYIKDFK